jgi:hypothetical protein
MRRTKKFDNGEMLENYDEIPGDHRKSPDWFPD